MTMAENTRHATADRARTCWPVCVGCGRLPRAGAPLCDPCRRCLAHVCFGKTRTGKETARGIASTYATVAYECPVCGTCHTGNDSRAGRHNHADAVLICLRLNRFAPEWLQALAYAWRPEAADRATWRAAPSAHRSTRRAEGAPT